MTQSHFVQLTEEQFDEQFGHVQSPEGSFFHDLEWTPEIEAALQERRLWTAVDGDEVENTFLLSGVHYVNRFAYVIAKHPHDPGIDYEAMLDCPEDFTS